MSWKQLWVAALAVVAVVSSRATAQNEKNQLTGIVGRTSISNEGIKGATFSNPFVRFGNGLTFEVNYSRYSWAAEPSGTSSVMCLVNQRS